MSGENLGSRGKEKVADGIGMGETGVRLITWKTSERGCRPNAVSQKCYEIRLKMVVCIANTCSQDCQAIPRG